MKQASAPRSLIFLAFLAIYFVWGTTYLAIAFGINDFAPFVLSSLRYLIAGALLTGWCFARKYAWPSAKKIRVYIVSGILMLVGGTGLVVVAEKYISTGYAAIIIASEPLLFMLFDKKRWNTYFSNVWVVIGLLSGFGGIVMFGIFSPDSSAVAEGKIYGILIACTGAILWVTGTLYAEKNNVDSDQSSAISVTAIQLIAAGTVCSIIALFAGDWNSFRPELISWQAWSALAFLVIMGSIVTYVAFNWLITVQPPALVSTHTYVNPVVALILGWLLLNEPISTMQVVSLVVVLVGVMLSRLSTAELH